MIHVNKSEYTRAHCRKTSFSGIRFDPILQNVEIWVLGRMVEEVSQVALALDKEAVKTAYAKAFNLDPELVQME